MFNNVVYHEVNVPVDELFVPVKLPYRVFDDVTLVTDKLANLIYLVGVEKLSLKSQHNSSL